jgi:hypothetical protein
MLKFLLSFAGVFAGLFAWGVIADAQVLKYQERGVLWLATLLIALPTAYAWGVAEVLDRARPRKAFDPRAKRPWTLVFAGLASGLLSVVIATPLITLLQSMSDATMIGIASAAGTTIVLLALGRKRAGECVHCGYDLSGAQDARCPECGAMYSR